jgi:type IV secretion system protein VirB10
LTRAEEENVAGERGLPEVRRSRSVYSRLSNLLALGLMLAMGVAVLAMYYQHAARRQAQARERAQAVSSSRARAEMPLPALGAIAPPNTSAPSPGLIDPIEQAAGTSGQPIPFQSQSSTALAPAAATPASTRPSSLERRLTGAAFAAASPTSGGQTAMPAAEEASHTGGEAPVAATIASASPPKSPAGATGHSEMGLLLHGDTTPAASAQVLPTQRLLLPKGAFIDCTLETAIDSTLPGMTTCVTATDTFGVDGQIVLLERGTKLIGETRGEVQQGSARVFVLWIEARTPSGVIVPLDSPGTDQLGRSGLAGTVDRHFWERFGAALLISTIDGAVQAAVQSSDRGDGTIIYNPSATQEVTTEVLKSTLSIAPTVRVENGDRIQVLVARDVDFTPVYELRRAVNQQ